MLNHLKFKPYQLAYKIPTVPMKRFMERHYALRNMHEQADGYFIVFDEFFSLDNEDSSPAGAMASFA